MMKTNQLPTRTPTDRAARHSVRSWNDKKSPASVTCSPGSQSIEAPSGVLKTWWKELLFLSVSAIAILGLDLFLWHFNYQKVPSWSFPSTGRASGSIAANALHVSFGTVLDQFKIVISLIAIPLGKCCGQLTWVWFAGEKRLLADYPLFESGARGDIFSTAKLMWRLKLRLA